MYITRLIVTIVVVDYPFPSHNWKPIISTDAVDFNPNPSILHVPRAYLASIPKPSALAQLFLRLHGVANARK
jgi:hypothetical protein